MKELKNILSELQKEGNKSPQTFNMTYEGGYQEGYWDGLKFAAQLIDKKLKSLKK